MKTVILAGGFGTRLSEESHLKPKPMIEIGGKPILWHIMKYYSSFGFKDFIICCGYKGYCIKEYFSNYLLHNSDIKVNLAGQKIEIISPPKEDWNIELIDTGEKTMTGGRLLRVKNLLTERFFLTYGDGLTDQNLNDLLEFHIAQKTKVTVTAIQPLGRFGSIEISGSRVRRFTEKPVGDHRWISGGYFVCEPDALSYIKDDDTIWEKFPLDNMSKENELSVYKHEGFWSCMDTLKDKEYLDKLIHEGRTPWLKQVAD